jgi:hypothetical protein
MAKKKAVASPAEEESKSPDSSPEVEEAGTKTPENIIVTIQVGHRVNYVMKDGQIRPLDVVRIYPHNVINGVLLFDGLNDQDNIPALNEDEEMPMVRISDAPHREAVMPVMWLTCVHYDAQCAPGTWHESEDQDEAEGLGEIPSQQEVEELRQMVIGLEQQVKSLTPKESKEKETKET